MKLPEDHIQETRVIRPPEELRMLSVEVDTCTVVLHYVQHMRTTPRRAVKKVSLLAL